MFDACFRFSSMLLFMSFDVLLVALIGDHKSTVYFYLCYIYIYIYICLSLRIFFLK